MAKAADPDFRHQLTPELKAMLDGDASLSAKWEALTPLARNEWICWTLSAKQEATREKRRERLHEEILAGKSAHAAGPAARTGAKARASSSTHDPLASSPPLVACYA